MKLTVIGLLGFVALSACATTDYAIEPVPTSSQTVRYLKGVATSSSVLEGSAVQVTQRGRAPNGRMTFSVAVLNTGDRPVDLSYDNVAAEDRLGRPIHLFDIGTLQKEAKRQAALNSFAVALSAAASSYSAAQAATTTTNTTISSPYGTTYATSTTYNPALANALTNAQVQRSSRDMAAIASRLDDTLAGLDGHILQRTTIDPGMSYGGDVVLDAFEDNKSASYPQDVFLTVRVNGEVHRFQFNVHYQQFDSKRRS